MLQKRKVAFITGITGQDGSILARFLLEKSYVVHGLRQYAATDDTQRIDDLIEHPDFHLHYGDMADGGNLWRLLSDIKPDEVYNLAALSHVAVSFEAPEAAAQINALGTLRLLEAIRGLDMVGSARFYQASSSEMYGNAPAPQNEETPFAPCSPYATSKLAAYWYVRNYRESYGLHASNGILFNHESAVRGEGFLTRKVSRAVASMMAGLQENLSVGNLDARRDWGHADDYIEGMWMMLQHDTPDDYVLATGEDKTVRDFINVAFGCVGIDVVWQGSGLQEKGINKATGDILVDIDPQFFRPNEVHHLLGDAAKAKNILGWSPKTGFEALVRDMVEADLKDLSKQHPSIMENPENNVYHLFAAE